MMSLLITAPLIILAMAPGGASGRTPATSVAAPNLGDAQMNNLWDFIVKGGPVMIVIGLCSLVALAIIIERWVVLRRSRVVPREFVANVCTVAHDRTRALDACRANNSPIARVFEAALKHADASLEYQDRQVEEVGQRELTSLRHRMRLLSALPQVSTLLGLLGTIFGMIKTFQVVAVTGQALGKTEQLAKGIFEAWTCTAAGLLVAIVVLIFYHVLMGRIDSLTAELDRVAADFLEHLRAKPGVNTSPLAAAPSSNGQATAHPTVDEPATGAVAATA